MRRCIICHIIEEDNSGEYTYFICDECKQDIANNLVDEE
jgi:hypothetical protein